MRFRDLSKFVFILISFLSASQAFCMQGFGIEDVDLSKINLDELNKIEDEHSKTTRMEDDELLIAAGTLAEFIKTPLWISTKAPQGRDILYHIPYKIAAIEYGGFAANIFFNRTNSMHVSAGNLLIDLGKPESAGFKSVIELLLGNLVGPENQRDLSSIVPILGTITIQEHKVGALLQGGVIKGPFTLQLHTSLQAAERNFWISKSYQRLLKKTFEEHDKGGQFDYSELYRFRFGMGDTRLKLGMNTVNMTDFQNDFGFELIIPTSRLSHGSTVSADPTEILNDTSSNDAMQESIANVLRGIRDYLIDPTLGNGHLGLGCYMESRVDMFHKLLQLWMRLSYDKLFPGEEYRMFMFKRTITSNELSEAVDTGDVNKVRPPLNKYLQQYILPSSFKSEVYPGGIFNFVLAASAEINKMKLALGYDYYAQPGERIRKLYNTTVSLSDLRVEDTESDSVDQHKIFAEGVYVKKYKRCDVGYGLGGDVAVLSRGIGDDWTVYFKIAASF